MRKFKAVGTPNHDTDTNTSFDFSNGADGGMMSRTEGAAA